MIYAPQKLLAETDRSTLSLLMLIAALGSRQHRLLFVHRFDGQIVSVEDYDHTMTRFLIQELIDQGETLIAQYTEDTAPETRCKVRTVTSSDGDFGMEFLVEKTAIKKIPGGYEVLPQASHANSPDPSSTAITVTAS